MTVSRRMWVAAGILVVAVTGAVTIDMLRHDPGSSAPRENSMMSNYADRPVIAKGTGSRTARLPRVRGPVGLALVCLQKRPITIEVVRRGKRLWTFTGSCEDGISGSYRAPTRDWPDTVIVTNARPDTRWTIFGTMTDRVG